VIRAFLAGPHEMAPKRAGAPIWLGEESFARRSSKNSVDTFLRIQVKKGVLLQVQVKKGVLPLESRETNHTDRNHVVTPYGVSTTSPLSQKFIQ